MSDSNPKPSPKLVTSQRCKARTKTCRDCGYRFKAGDKRWKCPECKQDRRCRNNTEPGFTVCRQHGANKEAVLPHITAKTFIAVQIADAYNRIIDNPDLLSLAHNIAILEARGDELQRMLEASDSRIAHHQIMASIRVIQLGLRGRYTREGTPLGPDLDMVRDGIAALEEAVSPVMIEFALWREISNNYELLRRMNDTERRWLAANEQMVPMPLVLEAIVITITKALRYIPSADDRAAYAREMRALMPSYAT